MNAVLVIFTMSIMTILLRFLPFLIFRNKVPQYIAYLGEVLPSAIIGMLVIYCLKDITLNTYPFGIQEMIAVVCVVCIQAWKRNSLVSILSGTVVYMLLVQIGI